MVFNAAFTSRKTGKLSNIHARDWLDKSVLLYEAVLHSP